MDFVAVVDFQLPDVLFFSPRGEDTKTAQPTCSTGKGNGRQVGTVFYICYRLQINIEE